MKKDGLGRGIQCLGKENSLSFEFLNLQFNSSLFQACDLNYIAFFEANIIEGHFVALNWL